MGLEERTVETVERHCTVCGTPLTEQEIEIALEEDAPALCTRCAIELVDLDEEDETESDGTPPSPS